MARTKRKPIAVSKRGRRLVAAAKRAPKPKLDDSAAVAGAVRVYTEWDPQKIKLAEGQADSGSLHYAARICDWVLGDDRVAGALAARTDALMGLTPTFEEGSGRRAKRALKALEAGEDFWDAYPEAQLTQLVTWGVLLGVGLAQQKPWVRRPDHGGRMLPTVEAWPPHSLSYNQRERVWVVRDDTSREIPIDIRTGEWLLHLPYGGQRPWAYGLWRSLARWVLLKHYATLDWARHGEKAATLVVTTPEKATKEARRDLADQLGRLGEDAIVALAAGFDLKLVEVAANTRQIYEAQIQMANEAIAIRIRGGNLSTSVSDKGSFAAAKVQADTGDGAKLRFDAAALSNTLHDQGLSPWAQLNYGDARFAPWPMYPVEPKEDKSARAGMVKTLGEGLTILDDLGFDIDEKAVREEFGLSFVTGRSERSEPTPPESDDGGEDDDDGDDEQARGNVRLAAGARAEKTSGFIDGQHYVDDLVDEHSKEAGTSFDAGFLAELLEAIDGADSYEAIRDAVIERYEAASSPDEMRELLRKAMLLADLAGGAAVRQDAD